MNRTKLKNYAPQARKDFIQAVTAKAAQYGLTASKIEPMTEKGDVVLISGKPFPKSVGDKRKRLEDRIKKNGFEYTMEAMAYTWFNRLVAVRYMELHGYLEHGFRVLSHPEGHAQPEILEKAQYVDLPGLAQKKVIELKLDGTKEEDLYRLLLTAQFNALSKAMPFLFEKIDDETELLLPDNLLNSDSLIRKLVTEIDEEDWKEVEIIGWLYQFYVEKEKERIDKYAKNRPVETQDIPAKTQLFTPNWIVKYLVQNTIGRQWLATYSQSTLRSKMEYYIEPAEQTPEVQEQLNAITPRSLNPEELTLLDPACGSGHILVEAYDLFKAIYEERGYRSKDIPALILQKNLFGLEIDDRAAQLAAFALMMKARADYPRIFDSEAQPNVVSFVESKGLDAEEIHYALMSPLPSEKQTIEPPRPDGFLFETENNLFTHAAEAKAAQTVASRTLPDITKEDIAALIALFENAKTFGSLIQVSPKLAVKLPLIQKRLNDVLAHGDLIHIAARVLEPLIRQAELLAKQYNSVVANPPYMGGKFYSEPLKTFIKKSYEDVRADLYSCFLHRNLLLCASNGFTGMITIPNWMFLASFEYIRKSIFEKQTIDSFIHNGRGVFGSDFGSCSFVIRNSSQPTYRGTFRRLFEKQGEVLPNEELERRFHIVKNYTPLNADFNKIPGSPIAYWASEGMKSAFSRFPSLSTVATAAKGMFTGNDLEFVRLWWEVDSSNIRRYCESHEASAKSSEKWYPFVKGGAYRRWYGNLVHVVNFLSDGKELKASGGYGERNPELYFKESLTWTDVTSAGTFAVRLCERGCLPSTVGNCIHNDQVSLIALAGLLCSKISSEALKALNPTIHSNPGDLSLIPFCMPTSPRYEAIAADLIAIHREDWDSSETSLDFKKPPFLLNDARTLQGSFAEVEKAINHRCQQALELERENNRLVIECYDVGKDVSPDVLPESITLYRPVRDEDIKRLLSYAMGCVMGRYSLDKPGLIYALGNNEGFDPSQYKSFRADGDGIVPLLEVDWGFQDDAANRIFEFVGVVWPKETLEENLTFISDSLGPSGKEEPRDTIRRYLSTGFYKHHLRSKPAERNGQILPSMYRNRPIYWLFSSGKRRAFQCLVYLHRYNEGTLARMRTEYVIPLMGKMTARLEYLQGPPEQKGAGGELAAASAVTVKRKLEAERDKIKEQLSELQGFDERLRHYADLRIKIDLDAGVRVNYGRFSDPEYGEILADVKTICGTTDED